MRMRFFQGLAIFLFLGVVSAPAQLGLRATNLSYRTECAEESNINIPLYGRMKSFVLEATHPTYEFDEDNCERDLAHCPPLDLMMEKEPTVVKLFDDGETVIEAVTELKWWRPRGMLASVDKGMEVRNVHYLRIYRKMVDRDSWPQFMVIYSDGGVRLCPQPPVGKENVCFGSFVVVGPAAPGRKPYADVISARYLTESKKMIVVYKDGGFATFDLKQVTRDHARIKVKVDYPTDKLPFAIVRSMYVEPGKADVDMVRWKDAAGTAHENDVTTFKGGEGVEWSFSRAIPSRHNTSAPDIRIALE
jgi:hypothetical protein